MGAGNALNYTGQGIYEIGAGVGGGLFQIGTGVQAIGEGAGYGLSGFNPQDIIQTILTLGKNEASTYTNQTLKLSQDTATSQGQDGGASVFAKSQASIEETPTPKYNGGSLLKGGIIGGGGNQLTSNAVKYVGSAASAATKAVATNIATATQTYTKEQKEVLKIAPLLSTNKYIASSVATSPIGLLSSWVSNKFRR